MSPAVVGLRVVFRSAVVVRSVVRLFCPVWAFSVAGGLLFACRAVVPCGGCMGACMGWGSGAVCSLFLPLFAMIAGESFRLLCSLLFVGVPCPCGAVRGCPWVFPCLILSRGLWGLSAALEKRRAVKHITPVFLCTLIPKLYKLLRLLSSVASVNR